jgi:parvulin-like peptidyl-prolyl isomerase
MSRLYILFSVFVLLLSSCDKEKREVSSEVSARQEAMKNIIILRIQDSYYFNSDFEKYLQLTIGKGYESLSDVSLSRLVENFIDEKIVLQAAKGQEISLSWEEKKEYLAKQENESLNEFNPRSPDESELDLMLDQLLVEKYTYSLVKDVEVAEEEIEDYYAQHKREFLLQERVDVSQILLPSEERAVEILDRVKDSTSDDFMKIAQAESIGVEASRGGKMGVFEMGQLPSEMEKVIFSLKEGEVSPVFESSYGYHIFRLDAKYEPELIPQEKASSSIRMEILSQKIKEHLSQHIDTLKDSLDWDFFPQNLYFQYQRNLNDSDT